MPAGVSNHPSPTWAATDERVYTDVLNYMLPTGLSSQRVIAQE